MFENAIPGTGGIMKRIADRVGCDWHTAKKYVTERCAGAKKLYEAERAGILDEAEEKVIAAIRDGDMSTVRWYLSTVGKDRGYTERREEVQTTGIMVEIDL
jgi:hypothetical protein